MRPVVVLSLLMTAFSAVTHAGAQDTDRDGVSDRLENALLQRFEPRWYISRADCSVRPARFVPEIVSPTVAADDGTIYGQAFPGKGAGRGGEIELHFYHLWRKDCGRMGHSLDTEHVAVLLRGEGEDAADWKAVYWYAAAHEDTICDASQVTRASTIGAESGGAKVWISAGKHASYLNRELCEHGCGGDSCEDMELLHTTLVPLGEAEAPMGGAVWIRSARWPLREKMTRSDFRLELRNRVDALPETDIAWAEPEKRPVQAAILGGNRTVDGAIVGESATVRGLSTGNRNTNSAISLAGANTGDALGRSFRAVGHALAVARQKTGKALGVPSHEP